VQGKFAANIVGCVHSDSDITPLGVETIDTSQGPDGTRRDVIDAM